MAVLQYAGVAFFAFLSLTCLWGAINGAWHREWKFVGAAMILMLIFVLGTFQAYDVSQGRRFPPDPDEIRIR